MAINFIGQTLLNQYRVDAFIASGGMGAVYKVWDVKRSVPLAMKVLHADFMDDAASFKYFQREARALQKLRHPNIVPFYGLFQDGNVAFLLEHYIDGSSLRDILQKHKNGLPLSEAMAYMQALCAALGYAHSMGVVHCDIKPANVMTDSGGQIYLADFGIARHAESATTTIAGAGTPAYMSPEQIRAEPVNARADIYSLGVLLFEILTGQRPFHGDEPLLQEKGATKGERIRYAHLHLQPPDPRGINPAIPPALSAITLKCMEKNPKARYASTSELLAALATLRIQAAPRAQVLIANSTSAPEKKAPARQTDQRQNKAWQKFAAPLALTFLIGCAVVGAAALTLISGKPDLPTQVPPPSVFSSPIPTYPVSVSEEQASPAPAPSATPAAVVDAASPVVPHTIARSPGLHDLVFVSDKGNPDSLRIVSASSDNLSSYTIYPLPSGYSKAKWPTFCGDKIAAEFVGKNAPQWIYLVDNVSEPIQLNPSGYAARLGVPRCSPDGRYIAYAATQNGSDWDLLTMDLLNRSQLISYPENGFIAYASWFSDGRSFVYVSRNNVVKIVYDITTDTEAQKYKVPSFYYYISASPDGSQVAYPCYRNKKIVEVCVKNVNGSSPERRIFSANLGNDGMDEKITPAWSADGMWIYFSNFNGGDWDIYRVRPDGSDAQNLTQDWLSNEVMPFAR